MELLSNLAMEYLRGAIADLRIKGNRLGWLVETGATSRIRTRANREMKQLTRQIQAGLNDLTKVESE